MNQVYFYRYRLEWDASDARRGLNPFMNQVYFYILQRGYRQVVCLRLNPFMNQVYFYEFISLLKQDGFTYCLNPFMNQVYFYRDFSPSGPSEYIS